MSVVLARPVLAALVVLSSACVAAPAAPPEPEAASAAAPAVTRDQRRCGWLQVRGPREAVLTDRDGDWLLARAGEHRAAGDWRPGFAAGQSLRTADVETGCACLTAQVDLGTHRVASARAPQARPLAACRGDRALDTPAEALARPAPRKTLRTPAFGLSYPADWRARRDQDCVSLEAPHRLAGEDYTLRLCARPGTLAEAADAQFFSPGDDGAWTRTAGMAPPSPVDWMFGPGWSGMVAVQMCGVGDAETGFHAAGGECLMFAGSDGRRAIDADSLGYYADFDVLRGILRSIRFEPAPKGAEAP